MAATMLRIRRDLNASSRQVQAETATQKPTGMVISRDELAKLKTLLAAEETERTTATFKATEKQQMAALARTKREQINAIDEERHHNRPEQHVEPDFAQLELARRSKRKQDEDRDEVKGMNSLMLQSKCATTLGVQIEEKKALAAMHIDEHRRIETAMEMERLRALKAIEDQEQKRLEDRRKGALVIKAQLEEREAERLRQLELKHQEQQMMLQHIEKLKEEERKVAEKKRLSSRQLMQDIAVANAEQIRMKARQRELEVAEERRVAEYLKEKQRRETELVEEQEHLRAEREREVARLRSLQEKAQDLQAEADAVRAKRAQDAYEREERLKRQREQERRARMERELAEAREIQKREKEVTLTEQTQLEKEEFEYVMAMQQLGDSADRRAQEEERRRRLEHQLELKDQIDHLREQKKLEKRAYVQQGRLMQIEMQTHKKYMDFVRDEKLHQLADEGIPEQFRVPLMRSRRPEPLRPALK